MHDDITFNGEPRRIEPGATVASLIAELGFKPQYVAVEVNLELVPRAQHAARVLAPGDVLEIVTLVGGG